MALARWALVKSGVANSFTIHAEYGIPERHDFSIQAIPRLSEHNSLAYSTALITKPNVPLQGKRRICLELQCLIQSFYIYPERKLEVGMSLHSTLRRTH
jgi:hypothetical protein